MKLTRLTGAAIGKGNFRHFMEKELHEHPAVIGDTLHRMVDPGDARRRAARRCRSTSPASRASPSAPAARAFYAGLVGRWWFEAIARIPTDGDVASEFRYRTPPLAQGGLGLLVSQSGETADTLAALRYMREQRPARAVGRQRAGEQHGARDRDAVLETVAGPEIGVASTKAFTAQLAVLACLALAAGAGARRDRPRTQEAAMTAALLEVPGRAAEVLEQRRDDPAHRRRASREARDVLYLGPRQLLPDRAGRRAEAEGDQLHPRRGLCRRRDEARADRADRPGRAGDRHRARPGRCSRRRPPTCRKRRRAAAR